MAQYVFTMNRLGKVVPPKREILKDISLSFFPGAKIGVLGLNGSGKSTLLKIMAGIDTDFIGEARPMANLKIGYLSQEPQLDPTKDVRGNVEDGLAEPINALKELDAVYAAYAEENADFDALAKRQAELEDIIQAWDAHSIEHKLEVAADALRLPPWDADVTKLSGGERRRVALCRLLMSRPDMLLLDEPTNHLDTESADKLTESLLGYDGTLIFVSHNLDFARRLSDTVWDVKNGTVTTYPGSLADYLTKLSEDEAAADARYGGTADPTRLASGVNADKVARIEAREAAQKAQSDHKKRKKAAEKRAQELEAEIQRLESEQSTLESALADPATHQDHQASREKGARYEVVKKRLNEAMEEWAAAEQERESLS